ncbi:MAG: hypothetical protein QF826_07250 [Acidimicrobiales bacterium]|nr:hypothetical protein [Acidimicrobiales bacterium]
MLNTHRSVLIGFIAAMVITMLLGCSTSEGAKTSPQETLDTTTSPSPPLEVTETVKSVDIVEGKKVLYIGHSFGRPFARELPSFVEMAGIDNHVQEIVFRGGPNGSPQSLWEDPKVRVEIQDILAEGDTDLLVMICCSENFLESRQSDWAVENWIDYALSVNPDTDFALALPWPDYPEDYENNEAYSERIIEAHESAWHPFIDDLRDLYPQSEIQSIFHGRAAVELRGLFESGSLPEISEMTSKRPPGIFTDRKGHAGQILLDLGTLIWLGTIYDIDMNDFPVSELKINGESYETDLLGMAQEILDDEKLIDSKTG